jgi:hypothetical protein
MVINVYDDSLGGYIGPFSFTNSIQPGVPSQSNTLDLRNKFISNKLRLEYQIPIEGSESNLELTQELLEGTFQSEVIMREVKVNEANAEIPAQSFTDSSKIDVTDEKYRIETGRISRGGALITFYNSIPLSAELIIKFPYLFQDGETLEFLIPKIEAGGSSQEYFDFSGAEIYNMDNPGTPIDSLPFYAEARADSSEGYVSIFGTDSFVVVVQMDSIFIESFQGVLLEPDTLTIEPVDQDGLDVFDDIEGQIRFEDLVMNLTFENEIDFDILIDLWIVGYRGDPEFNPTDSMRIHISETIQKSSTSPTTLISLDRNSGTPSIVDLLEILPTHIRMYGDAILGAEGNDPNGGAKVNDGIRALYSIESPLNFNITRPLSYTMETDSIDLDQDMRDRLVDDAYFTNIDMVLENGLPVEAEVVLIMATDSSLFDTLQTALPSERIIVRSMIDPGTVGTSGFVDVPVSSTISISLSDEQLDIFMVHPVYFKQWVNIPQTNQVVKLRQADEIKVDALLHTKLLMNRED